MWHRLGAWHVSRGLTMTLTLSTARSPSRGLARHDRVGLTAHPDGNLK